MKELSIEEKAQRYDEAIKRAKSIDVHEYGDIIEAIFPELKESEDERISGNIIATIHLYYGEPLDDEAKEMIAWLEKQGEHAKFYDSIQVGDKVTRNEDGVLVNLSQLKRVAKKDEKQCEQKSAWSEEDDIMAHDIDNALRSQITYPKSRLQSMSTWIGNLKNRVQSKQEWSEEDKERYKSCLQKLSTGNPEQPETINSKWFKEHVYPQVTWKPSEEQMEALDDFIYAKYPNIEKYGAAVKSLYQDLKKLKG